MCIIAAKPAGVPAPSLEALRNCWDSNPDGAGIAVSDGGAVIISKGYMNWEAFEEAVRNFGDLTASGVLYHFRIATHGGVRPECCHPFPLSRDMDALRALEISAPVAVAHNGVVHHQATDAETSDTMAYIRDVLAPLDAVSGGIMGNDTALGIAESTICGSRLALLDKSGRIDLAGDWVSDGGVFYSNASHRPAPVYRSGTFALWPDDECEEVSEADMLESLPFECCAGCDLAEECYFGGPQCFTLSEAAYNSSVSWYCDEREAL